MSGNLRGEDLLAKWNDESIPFDQRDELLSQMSEMGLYPRIMTAMDEWESEAGLYPDTEDPRFTEKLMRKQELSTDWLPQWVRG